MTQGNANVFPFRPFAQAGLDHARSLLVPTRSAPWDEIATVLGRFAGPSPTLQGLTPAAQVLSAFFDPHYAFGEQHILADKAEWLGRMDSAMATSDCLKFVLLGFPFKAQVSLKTLRQEPDLGEAVMLLRLATVARAIRASVGKAVQITICTEGILALTVDAPIVGTRRYVDALRRMVQRLRLDDVLTIVDLIDLAATHVGFNDLWRSQAKLFEDALAQGDPVAVQAYAAVFPVIRHMVPCADVLPTDVAAAYDTTLELSTISTSARELRCRIDQIARKGVPLYRGFLAARDAAGLLGALSPDALHMTVSPKRGRLGIRPLPAPIDILPYHGVPIVGESGLTIRYLCEAVTSERLIGVSWADDEDTAPFYYLEALS